MVGNNGRGKTNWLEAIHILSTTKSFKTAKPQETIRFEKELAINMARDVDDNPVYLAPNKYNLQLAIERWPQVGFHDTREHGQKLAH